MAAVQPPVCDFGWAPTDFSLMGTDGKTYTLADVSGPKGTVVMFICNHCPYVKAVAQRITRDIRELQAEGIGAIAVMSNDPGTFPEDSFDNMKSFAATHGFTFPYVIDETQEVGHAWGAICTPDFFGFNAAMQLQYRGRLDSSGPHPGPADAKRELFDAMMQIAETGAGPQSQTASIGCSIKWRAA